jgi:hypothetical protein
MAFFSQQASGNRKAPRRTTFQRGKSDLGNGLVVAWLGCSAHSAGSCDTGSLVPRFSLTHTAGWPSRDSAGLIWSSAFGRFTRDSRVWVGLISFAAAYGRQGQAGKQDWVGGQKDLVGQTDGWTDGIGHCICIGRRRGAHLLHHHRLGYPISSGSRFLSFFLLFRFFRSFPSSSAVSSARRSSGRAKLGSIK